MHAIAHRGCTDTIRESALKVDSGRKIPCCTRESKLHQRRVGPLLYQLSNIPILDSDPEVVPAYMYVVPTLLDDSPQSAAHGAGALWVPGSSQAARH